MNFYSFFSFNQNFNCSVRYPTFCKLAGVDDCDDAATFADGKVHGIDGVDVWPLLAGDNATQPRSLTPTSEVAIIDSSNRDRWFKLVTLAGQSQYYNPNQTAVIPHDTCLQARQPDPPQPGRTDPIITGSDCPVCNASHPCLFSLLDDPRETTNLAQDHPSVVKRLQRAVESFQTSYVSGSLTPRELENFEKIKYPSKYWQGYLGPCYLKVKK